MHVRRHSAIVEIWTPAKLNLFLEVLARRSDGFHEIETLICPIALYDTLYATDDPTGRVTLACEPLVEPPARRLSEPNLPPGGNENLVVRAIEALRRRAGASRGLAVRLVKRIPMAAGLAGGSSDAAAALVAANIVWGLGLDRAALAEVAAELGSDVPFFLGRRSAVCRGRGERIEPVATPYGLWFVVVRPPEGLSTADVYRRCRPADAPSSAEPLVRSLRRGDLAGAAKSFHNRLEPAAAELCPWMKRLDGELAGAGVLGRGMSGSGSSWFGLCSSRYHARRVARRLSVRGIGRVYSVCASP